MRPENRLDFRPWVGYDTVPVFDQGTGRQVEELVYGYDPIPSLQEVNRSIAKPLKHSVVTDVSGLTGEDTLTITSSGSASDVAVQISPTEFDFQLPAGDGTFLSGTSGVLTGLDVLELTFGAGDDSFRDRSRVGDCIAHRWR